jgi:Cof subfamily protein (haloacid dehalogenase superfamily)
LSAGSPTVPQGDRRLRRGAPPAHPGGCGAALTRFPIRLLLADVDGTLVTTDKILSDRAVAAVRRLKDEGILFAITSGRPPRGMSMLVDPLDLNTPIAAFNGGLLVHRDLSVIRQETIPAEVVAPAISLLESFRLSVWLYRGADWYVRDLHGPHVEREAWTVRFAPTLLADYDDVKDDVVKIVGVSDDVEAVAAASTAAQSEFGDGVSAARSQSYYLDITHPNANKGSVAKILCARYGIPSEQLATIGDMPNDVLMFAHSGLSIAMGNASLEVQRAARRITTTNDDQGFANAVDRYLLQTG